ncbi:DUF7827 domain-containing protein [Haladaptatus sp. NG-SE-30]
MNVRQALTSVVVVSLLAGTAIAGSAGSATHTTQNPAVQSPLLYQQADGNGTVTLNRSIYEVQHGETAVMNLSLTDLDGITFQVGGGQADYKLNATVTDGNGDGQIVLLFDTSKAGSGDGAALTTKADADNLTVKNETKVDSFEPNMYGLTVYAGTSENVSTVALGGLDVQGDETTGGTTTTTTTSDDDSSDETTTTTTGTTESTESDGQPGFGVGVAIAALAGVALLARRR